VLFARLGYVGRTREALLLHRSATAGRPLRALARRGRSGVSFSDGMILALGAGENAITIRAGATLIKSVGILSVVTWTAMSIFSAVSGAPRQRPQTPPAQSWNLGEGVTLAIDDVAETGPGLVELIVTVANHGGTPMKLEHKSFALCGAAGERYPALLPSELGQRARATHLLRGGLLASGQVSSAILYFAAPSVASRTVDLRVDLANAYGRPISQTYLPVALN
jgi:hypothetical protein